jgi:DNA-binding CsgD family transcriptional regulator
VAWRREDGAGMIAACEEAARFFREGNDLAGLPLTLIVLAVADHRMGDHARAEARLDEAAGLADLGGFTWGGAAARYYLGEVLASLGRLAEAAAAYHASLIASWRMGDPWTTGAGIGGLATVAAMHGRTETAARLFGAADALCASADAPLPVLDRGDFARVVAAARAARGKAAFARAYAAGAALPPDAAIIEAEAVIAERPGAGPPPSLAAPRLTPRELAVLRLVAEGRSNKEISSSLKLKTRTVEGYVGALLDKFEAPSRAALTAQAIRRKLV